MKTTMKLMIVLLGSVPGVSANADDAHSSKPGALVAACKIECAAAKTEHEAHECTKKMAAKKDPKFEKSACFKAHIEHEKHEKSDGHKH